MCLSLYALLSRMLVIDLHAKNQHNISKCIEKSLGNCSIGEQEGHDGPVTLHWLIREIPSYKALQYLGIGLKHRPVTRTKIVSQSSYV